MSPRSPRLATSPQAGVDYDTASDNDDQLYSTHASPSSASKSSHSLPTKQKLIPSPFTRSQSKSIPLANRYTVNDRNKFNVSVNNSIDSRYQYEEQDDEDHNSGDDETCDLTLNNGSSFSVKKANNSSLGGSVENRRTPLVPKSVLRSPRSTYVGAYVSSCRSQYMPKETSKPSSWFSRLFSNPSRNSIIDRQSNIFKSVSD